MPKRAAWCRHDPSHNRQVLSRVHQQYTEGAFVKIQNGELKVIAFVRIPKGWTQVGLGCSAPAMPLAVCFFIGKSKFY